MKNFKNFIHQLGQAKTVEQQIGWHLNFNTGYVEFRGKKDVSAAEKYINKLVRDGLLLDVSDEEDRNDGKTTKIRYFIGRKQYQNPLVHATFMKMITLTADIIAVFEIDDSN